MKKEFLAAKEKYEAAATEHENERAVMEALIKRRDTLATDLPNLEEAVNKAQENNNLITRQHALGEVGEKESAEAFEVLNNTSINFDRALVEHSTIVGEVEKTQQGMDKKRELLRHAKQAFWCAVRNDHIATAVKAAGPHLQKIHALSFPAGSMQIGLSTFMDGAIKETFDDFSRANHKANDATRQKLAEEYGIPT